MGKQALNTFLASSLNVELVVVILQSLTKFTKSESLRVENTDGSLASLKVEKPDFNSLNFDD
mgnify:CR=1 FL=1